MIKTCFPSAFSPTDIGKTRARACKQRNINYSQRLFNFLPFPDCSRFPLFCAYRTNANALTDVVFNTHNWSKTLVETGHYVGDENSVLHPLRTNGTNKRRETMVFIRK